MEKKTNVTEKEENISFPDDTLVDISHISIFPDDILFDIFSRLSVKSLLRIRCTSKYLFDLIRNPYFVKMHLHYSTSCAATRDYGKKSLFLVSTTPSHDLCFMNCINFNYNSSPPKSFQLDYFNLPIWFHDHTIRVEEEDSSHDKMVKSGGSCNGLIFLYSYCGTCNYHVMEYDYFLWNPSTRELKKLPYRECNEDPHRVYGDFSFNGFGYDHIIDDYKVIDIVCHQHDVDDLVYTEIIIYVYTLGSNSWSTKVNTDQLGLSELGVKKNILCTINEGCFFNGSLHWLLKSAIITMSIHTLEVEHRQLKPPNTGHRRLLISMPKLEVLNGCLCLINYVLSEDNYIIVEFWMMKDYGVNGSWTKLFIIDRQKSLNISGSWFTLNLKPIKLCKDGEILMVLNKRYLVLYDLKNEKHIWVHNIRIVFAVESYIESLVSLKSATYLTAADQQQELLKINEDEEE